MRLEASIASPNPGVVYNVCDDLPEEPAKVVEFACSLLGCKAPPLTPIDRAGLSPMAESFYQDNKRVSNRRIRGELGVELAYPTYVEGLRALLRSGA